MAEDIEFLFNDDDNEPVIKDIPFNPWRYAKSDKAIGLVREAITNVDLFEKHRAPRKRKRKSKDLSIFELTIAAILCDLMHHRLYQRSNAIYVSRSNKVLGKKSRYRPQVYGKTFPDVLDKLAAPELGWINQAIGDAEWSDKSKRTTISPGERLIDRMKHLAIDKEDLGLNDAADPIVLKREKADWWDDGGVLEYADTSQTGNLRHQMQEINLWLKGANLDCMSSGSFKRAIPDTAERALRRIFTQGNFNSGGRLFGGFWQPMSKAERFDRLLIDDEEVAELDYGQMGARQLYGLKGATPDSDDLYRVPGFEDHRRGIKVIFSAMTFQNKPLLRMPQGVRKQFEDRYKISDVTTAIEERHPAIKDLFYQGIGHHLQFLESQIMVNILLTLKGLGVVALPIHDAVIVSRSRAPMAREVMLDVFIKHTGVEGSVSVEGGDDSVSLPPLVKPYVPPKVPLYEGGREDYSSPYTIRNTSGSSSMGDS